jgi:hypothetical protein
MVHIPHKPAAPPPTKDVVAVPVESGAPTTASAGPAPMQSGGIINTTSASHNSAVQAAEMARQASVAAATTQAQLTSAAITFHRAVLKSALANACGTEASMSALRALGVTGL